VLHALANTAERGELRSTPRFLRSLIGARFAVRAVESLQPVPLHRVIFHPRLGRPRWAELPWLRRSVSALERGAESVVPRIAWAYVHVRADAAPAAPLEKQT